MISEGQTEMWPSRWLSGRTRRYEPVIDSAQTGRPARTADLFEFSTPGTLAGLAGAAHLLARARVLRCWASQIVRLHCN